MRDIDYEAILCTCILIFSIVFFGTKAYYANQEFTLREDIYDKYNNLCDNYSVNIVSTNKLNNEVSVYEKILGDNNIFKRKNKNIINRVIHLSSLLFLNGKGIEKGKNDIKTVNRNNNINKKENLNKRQLMTRNYFFLNNIEKLNKTNYLIHKNKKSKLVYKSLIDYTFFMAVLRTLIYRTRREL